MKKINQAISITVIIINAIVAISLADSVSPTDKELTAAVLLMITTGLSVISICRANEGHLHQH